VLNQSDHSQGNEANQEMSVDVFRRADKEGVAFEVAFCNTERILNAGQPMILMNDIPVGFIRLGSHDRVVAQQIKIFLHFAAINGQMLLRVDNLARFLIHLIHLPFHEEFFYLLLFVFELVWVCDYGVQIFNEFCVLVEFPVIMLFAPIADELFRDFPQFAVSALDFRLRITDFTLNVLFSFQV
jgi:hypothetical protein